MKLATTISESNSKSSEGIELMSSVSVGVHTQLEGTTPTNGLLSDDITRFIQIAHEKGILDKIHATNFYHIAPNYIQKKILEEGFHDKNEIFSEEQKEFLQSILKKLPEGKYSRYKIEEHILGIKDDEGSGIELKGKTYQFSNYQILNDIRFYFSILSESFDLLSINEKIKAQEYFIDFHNKLSQGTDIWEINIRNPRLNNCILSGFRSSYNYNKEQFIMACEYPTEIIADDRYRISGTIPPLYIRVIKTKKSEPIAMWTGRCKRLITELGL